MQYRYISVLWIQGLTAALVVQGRVEIAFMSAVIAVLLQYSAVGTDIICSVVCTGNRGIGVYGYSYCSTFTSVWYGYRDRLQCC